MCAGIALCTPARLLRSSAGTRRAGSSRRGPPLSTCQYQIEWPAVIRRFHIDVVRNAYTRPTTTPTPNVPLAAAASVTCTRCAGYLRILERSLCGPEPRSLRKFKARWALTSRLGVPSKAGTRSAPVPRIHATLRVSRPVTCKPRNNRRLGLRELGGANPSVRRSANRVACRGDAGAAAPGKYCSASETGDRRSLSPTSTIVGVVTFPANERRQLPLRLLIHPRKVLDPIRCP